MQLIKMKCSSCDAQLEIDLDNLQVFCPYCGQKLMMDFDQLGKVLAEKEKTKRTIEREQQQTRRIEMAYEHESREKDKERKSASRSQVGPLIIFILVIVSIAVLVLSISKSHKQKVAYLQQLEIEIEAAIQEGNYETAILKANKMYLDDSVSSEETATWDEKRIALLEIIESKQRESNLKDPNTIFMPAKSSSFKGKNYMDVVDQLRAAGFTNIKTQVASESPGLFNRDDTVEHILIGGKTEFTTEDCFKADTSIIIYYYSRQ